MPASFSDDRRAHRLVILATLLVVSSAFVAGSARADTEPPALYDARSTGMGGTGTAFIDDASAIYHNPANLNGFKRLSVAASFSPLFLRLKAPVVAPNTQETSETPLLPFFFAGAAVRLADMVAIGAGAYVRSGIGTEYKPAALGGASVKLGLVNLELAVPLTLTFTDWFSMGVGLRVIRTTLESEQPSPLANGAIVSQNADGWGAGAYVGLHFTPFSWWKIGAVYRSKASVDLSGDTDVPGVADNLPTESEWNSPHVARIGTSFSLWEDRILLAADFQAKFFKESSEALEVSIEAPGVPVQETELKWRNAYTGHLGAEFWVLPAWALRGGYSITRSATPKSTAFPFALPPGLIHNPTIGTGFRFWRMSLDVAFSYAMAEEELSEPSANGLPGTYREDGFVGSVSLAYRDE